MMMTNDYNKITLLYEIAFNKSSQIIYTNESVFFETIRTLSDILDVVELDKNRIINLDMSFLYNLWLEDKNLYTIYKTISSSGTEQTMSSQEHVHFYILEKMADVRIHS